MWLGKTANFFVTVFSKYIITFNLQKHFKILSNMNNYESLKTNFDCREDWVSMQLIKLLITEILVKFTILILKALIATFKRCLGKFDWRASFNEADEIVWVLYIQSLTWISALFFPSIIIVLPIL